jgi:hypothetical protein
MGITHHRRAAAALALALAVTSASGDARRPAARRRADGRRLPVLCRVARAGAGRRQEREDRASGPI